MAKHGEIGCQPEGTNQARDLVLGCKTWNLRLSSPPGGIARPSLENRSWHGVHGDLDRSSAAEDAAWKAEGVVGTGFDTGCPGRRQGEVDLMHTILCEIQELRKEVGELRSKHDGALACQCRGDAVQGSKVHLWPR